MSSATTYICNHCFLPRFIGTDSLVLDIGANHGDFAHSIIRRFHCRVISAEPVNELREGIARHSLLELLPVAVGAKNQMVSMNVFSDRCASVMRAMNPEEELSTQPIEMVTLAELRSRTHAQRVDLLKLDIEGAEVDLFNACSDEELQSIMQITVEFHDFLYPELKRDVAKILRRMRDIGFWVLPFSLDNTNVLFINKKTGVSFAEFVYLRTIVKYRECALRGLGFRDRDTGNFTYSSRVLSRL